MPFDYQTLKNLTDQSLVNLTVAGADLAANSVTTAKIAAATITAA
jgi:hypothetical protein